MNDKPRTPAVCSAGRGRPGRTLRTGADAPATDPARDLLMNTGTVVLVLLSLSAGLRAADDPEKSKGDPDALKGTWQVTSARVGGRDLPGAEAGDDRVTFDGKTYVQKRG